MMEGGGPEGHMMRLEDVHARWEGLFGTARPTSEKGNLNFQGQLRLQPRRNV